MADSSTRAFELLRQAKALAKEYYEPTGRPLGITGEVAAFHIGAVAIILNSIGSSATAQEHRPISSRTAGPALDNVRVFVRPAAPALSKFTIILVVLLLFGFGVSGLARDRSSRDV